MGLVLLTCPGDKTVSWANNNIMNILTNSTSWCLFNAANTQYFSIFSDLDLQNKNRTIIETSANTSRGI